MEKTCATCGDRFVLTENELRLYEKFDFEPKPQCFWCGQKQHLCFRNGRKLYRRTCDQTGENIVSMYAPDSQFTVYSADVWWSDEWDALHYGRDFDFDRPFFDQFAELMLEVPRIALTNVQPENSEYCNMCEGNKNSYLILGGDYNEDCMYGTFCMQNKNSMDCDTANDNEQCYFLLNSFDCYNCQFTFDSKNCSDCAFISDCIGCRDCILCTGLQNQQYCIRNKQLSKQEYELQSSELHSGSYGQQQRSWKDFLDVLSVRTVKYAHIVSCEECTGDYIKGSKGCQNCYDVWDCEDMQNIILAMKMKDGLNSTCIGHDSELCYDMQSTVRAYDCHHSVSVFDSKFVEYSDNIFNSEYVFGCSNLHKQKYCIFNKQFSESEYGDLKRKIVDHLKSTGEWGEFFPRSMSPFGYNESTAYDFFPMKKDEATAQGFTWRDAEDEVLDVKKVISADQLPDSISDIPDDILSWAIKCEQSKRPFKIIKQELEFYRRHNLPVPRLHPDERYLLRLSTKNPYRLWRRECAACRKQLQTSFSSERTERILCEECYRKEVY